MKLWKCHTQDASKLEKLSSGHRTGKGHSSPEMPFFRIFFPTPKRGNAKECTNHRTFTLISHTGRILLKILQVRLQQYMNWELPDVQAGFRKGRGTRDQIANIHWIIEKAREFLKNIYFCFFDYAKAFDCVDHNKLWNILKQIEIPNHLTCLLRNLYVGQEAKVRTGHGRIDWIQIGKGVCQGCILSPCLFNLYPELHQVKCWAGLSTSWNQDCWEKYQ